MADLGEPPELLPESHLGILTIAFDDPPERSRVLHASAAGVLSPEHFLSIAEASGSIVSAGEWVVGEACAQAAVGAATWRHG